MARVAEGLKGNLLFEPWDVKTARRPYKVFTTFWRACRSQQSPGAPLPGAAPKILPAPPSWPASDRLAAWHLKPSAPDWAGGLARGVDAGRSDSASRGFSSMRSVSYRQERDLPAGSATSRLSPHLAFGEISPRQIWRAADGARPVGGDREVPGGNRLARVRLQSPLPSRRPRPAQLPARVRCLSVGRRRGCARRLAARPHRLSHRRRRHARALDDRLDAQSRAHDRRVVPDQGPADRLAGRRALVLGHAGRRRSANNAAGWQWVAGSGADAAPYFRIFNPVLQGEKFDPDGDYVRRWVPELAGLAAETIHRPWTACPAMLPPDVYPACIVDHAARERALGAFRSLKRAPSAVALTMRTVPPAPS